MAIAVPGCTMISRYRIRSNAWRPFPRAQTSHSVSCSYVTVLTIHSTMEDEQNIHKTNARDSVPSRSDASSRSRRRV